MTTETIKVTVTYKDPITFHLRMIGIDEENTLRQKMFGLPEQEKAAKSYQNNVDLLANLSEQMPEGAMFEETPENADQVQTGGKSFGRVIQNYFRERTVIKERIAEYAVRGYFLKLQPDVSFS